MTTLDDGTLCVQLPAIGSAVALARMTVRERWADLPDNVLDDVQLIVAELVSNAVRHGRPDIELHLRGEPFTVNVAVLDHHPAQPPTRPQRPDVAATSGRGLLLVEELAERWGTEPLVDGSGKTVWASVTVPQ